MIALAGLAAGRVYSGQVLFLWVAGAAVGAVAVSRALRRAPAWLVAPVSVGTLIAYSLIVIRTTAEAALIDGGLVEVTLDAARNAIPRLLTALIPVEPQPDTVLGPVVLAWLAGLGAAELAGRLRRPALAMVPPTLLYIGALVLVGPNAGLVLWQPLAFAVLAATGLAASGAGTGAGAGFGGDPGLDGRERTALRLRTATGLGVGLVAVLAVVALVAPVVAGAVGRTPTDPRRYVSPPNLDLLDQNPLARVSGWGANPTQHLLDVAVLGGGSVASPSPSSKKSAKGADDASESTVDAHDTRLRLAVLTDWDGVTWHVGADYRTAGRVLPDPAPPPGLTGDGGEGGDDIGAPRTIVQRITVAELEGRLLPAVSAPHRVDGVRVAYDQVSGTLIRPEGLAPGVDYTVTSVNPPVDVNLLPAADVPSGPAVARYLTVGETVPPDLAKLAEKITSGEGSPYLRALALESFLPATTGTSATHRAGTRTRICVSSSSDRPTAAASAARRSSSPRRSRRWPDCSACLAGWWSASRCRPAAARSPARTGRPGPRFCSAAWAGCRSTHCPTRAASRNRWRRSTCPSRCRRRRRRRRWSRRRSHRCRRPRHRSGRRRVRRPGSPWVCSPAARVACWSAWSCWSCRWSWCCAPRNADAGWSGEAHPSECSAPGARSATRWRWPVRRRRPTSPRWRWPHTRRPWWRRHRDGCTRAARDPPRRRSTGWPPRSTRWVSPVGPRGRAGWSRTIRPPSRPGRARWGTPLRSGRGDRGGGGGGGP
jgi:hypothetical protein